MTSSLDSFLSTCKVGKGEDFTHTQLGSRAGSYYIPSSDTPEFHKLYKRALASKQCVHITEKHKSVSPVLIDLDFRQNNPERNYTHDHVIGFLNALQKEIFTHVRVGELPIYVLEKEAPRLDKSGKVYKDGIHAIIPGIVTCPALQHVFRDNILKNDPDVLKIPGVTNSIQDIYDEAVIERNNWFMYGSMKPDETFPWLVTHKYVIRDEGECFEEEVDQYDVSLVDLLSIRHGVYDESRYTVEGKAAISKFGKKRKAAPAEKIERKGERPALSKSPDDAGGPDNPDAGLAVQVVRLLAPQRASAYQSWMEVGWCLYSIQPSNALLRAWIEFSKLSTAHEHTCASECAEKWHTMKKGAYTIASLIFWARVDAPGALADIMKDLSFSKESRITIRELQMSDKLHSYQAVKSIFENTHFKVMTPAYVSLDINDDIIIRNESRMKTAFRNVWCSHGQEEKKKKKFIDLWFDDPRIRTYESTDFLPPPCICNGDMYNLWKGFAIDNVDAPSSGSVQPFLDHISILVGHDAKSYDYFVKWLAQIIQEPGRLIGIAVVFVSAEGAGKNIFLNAFADIIGKEYYFETADPKKDLFDTFSNGFRFKLLVDVDEAQSKDTFAISELLKKVIDSEKMTFRQKYVDNVTIRNFCRFVFTTNNDLCVKITDSTRRYVIFECSNEKVGDKDYFSGFHAYTQDPTNRKAIIEYLRNVDYKGYNWITERPITATYDSLKSLCSDEFLKFLVHLWTRNRTSADATFTGQPLFHMFVKFLRKGHKDKLQDWTNVRFGGKLGNLAKLPTSGITKKDNFGPKRASAYIFDIPTLTTFLLAKGLITKVTYDFLDMEDDEDGQDDMEDV
jgi:Family of unknown function (DUF5906)/Primase C terminal 2 (PriCT-2)